MNDSIITRLASWSSSLKHDDVPPRVLNKAALQVYSVIAAIHAGSRHEIGQALEEGVAQWAGDGPCTGLPSGKKMDVLSAVHLNAALSLALDYDDYLMFGHTGASAVTVSLAAAEKFGASTREAMVAQVVANEIEGRLGASVVMGPHNGQGWSHIHLAGAAAATARVMGLDAEKTAHAMAIALYQPTYVLWPGFMGPDSKAMTASSPAVIGVQSAMLAAKGATGALDIIEHPQGYMARMSYIPAPFFITGLGKSWVTDTLAYKIYPGCAYIDTSVDALLELRRTFEEETGRPLLAEEVEEVLVEASILTTEMDALSRTGGAFDPLNPVSVNFSIPGNVALVLLEGRLDAEDLSKKSLSENADHIRRITNKVRLEHDWSLTFRFLGAIDDTLKLRRLIREFGPARLAGLRSRMQGHYQSSMGLTLSDLREILLLSSEYRSALVKEAAKGLENLISRAGKKRSSRFDLGECDLTSFRMPFASRVTLSLKGGRKMERLQEIPWGGPGHPLDKTRDFVLDKFERELTRTLDADKVAKTLKWGREYALPESPPLLMELCSK